MQPLELLNCTRCGALITSSGTAICAECVAKEQNDFEQIRAYMRNNPTASVLDISVATGLSLRRIKEFVRQGRLVAAGMDAPRTESGPADGKSWNGRRPT